MSISLALAIGASALVPGACVAVGEPPVPPTHQCGEYVAGRVIAGEYQNLDCDVSPPQVLDLVMDDTRGDWVARCHDMGGRPWSHRDGTSRCQDIDY